MEKRGVDRLWRRPRDRTQSSAGVAANRLLRLEAITETALSHLELEQLLDELLERVGQTEAVARTPKWAQWQIDHPPPGFDPKTNRRFWRWMGIEVRFWLVWGAFIVLSALVLLILVLLAAM